MNLSGGGRGAGAREAGEEGVGSGILKLVGRGRNREKYAILRNIAQYSPIEKAQRGGWQQK